MNKKAIAGALAVVAILSNMKEAAAQNLPPDYYSINDALDKARWPYVSKRDSFYNAGKLTYKASSKTDAGIAYAGGFNFTSQATAKDKEDLKNVLNNYISVCNTHDSAIKSWLAQGLSTSVGTDCDWAKSSYPKTDFGNAAAPAPAQVKALKCAMSVNGGAAAGMCNGACGGFTNPQAFMAAQCQNCLDSYTSNYKTCLQQ